MYLRNRGMGSTTSLTAASIAGAGATTTVSLLVLLGTITGPVGAVIAGLIGIGVALVKVFQGCGATCVQATQYANQVEAALQQNLQAYLSAPVRTTSMQAAAVNNYNTAIAALQQACGQAALGQAGVNCIDERIDPNSCQWKASPGGWDTSTCTYTGYGASGSGTACWNWVIGYLDPIQNDPCVQPDSVLLSGGSSSTSANLPALSSITSSPLLLAGGLLVAALLLGGD